MYGDATGGDATGGDATGGDASGGDTPPPVGRPPLLVLVTGHPATGKTSLARRLATRLRVPSFSKDDLKETFFDAAGAGDRDWSRRVGRGAIALLYRYAAATLAAGGDVLLECNFDPRHARAEVLDLARVHGADVLEINLRAEPEDVLRRFLARAASGTRHPGHDDNPAMAEELRARLRVDAHACLFPEAEHDDGRPVEVDGVRVAALAFDTTHDVGIALAGAMERSVARVRRP